MSRHSADPPPGAEDPLKILLELRDLFRRRLLDDRDKRLLVEDLQDRVRRAEEGVALEYLLPLIFRLLLVVDRLDDYSGSDPAFIASIREETLLALSQHGVESIDGPGPVDPSVHEVIGVEGDDRTGGPLVVRRVVQRGFRYGGRLLRPARVIATAVVPPVADDGPRPAAAGVSDPAMTGGTGADPRWNPG